MPQLIREREKHMTSKGLWGVEFEFNLEINFDLQKLGKRNNSVKCKQLVFLSLRAASLLCPRHSFLTRQIEICTLEQSMYEEGSLEPKLTKPQGSK